MSPVLQSLGFSILISYTNAYKNHHHFILFYVKGQSKYNHYSITVYIYLVQVVVYVVSSFIISFVCLLSSQ